MIWIRWFDDIGLADVATVGGKNASLGEMRRALTPLGIRIPDGFATTADAYRDFLRAGDLERVIRGSLADIDIGDIDALQAAGTRLRSAMLAAPLPPALIDAIRDGYQRLEQQYGANCDVAVRSSATAEDLPEASFAGQQETFLNIHGETMLIDAVRRCYASLFTDRAIVYRVHHGFDHTLVALSVGVQKMVRSDLASAGVMFSIDTETGFSNAVLITGAYGLGESVVQGTVNPDEFYVFKPTLAKGFRPILQKKLGTKEFKLVYEEGGTRQTRSVPVSGDDRERFVLSDDDVLTLARWTVPRRGALFAAARDAARRWISNGRRTVAPASCFWCRRDPRRSIHSETRWSWSASTSTHGASCSPAAGASAKRLDRGLPESSARRRIWNGFSPARCSSPR